MSKVSKSLTLYNKVNRVVVYKYKVKIKHKIGSQEKLATKIFHKIFTVIKRDKKP